MGRWVEEEEVDRGRQGKSKGWREEEGETVSERKTFTTYKIQCQFCPKLKLHR